MSRRGKPRITCVSGSDSDLGGMVPVAKALGNAGASVRWTVLGPRQRELPPGRRNVVPVFAPPRGRVDETAEFTAAAQAHITRIWIDTQPEFVVLLGDRHEILAAASAACLLRVPFGQVHAGELARGQTDNRVRHAVGRMADLLFAPDSISERRLLQWGELRSRVFRVGSPFLDSLCPIAPLKRYRGLRPLRYLMCLLHPVSQDDAAEHQRADRLFGRLQRLAAQAREETGEPIRILLVEPCPDPGRRGIIRRWQEAVDAQPDRVLYQPRMNRRRYLQLLTHAHTIVANSSGLFTEAAPLGVPMVQVGHRQKGRTLVAPPARRRPVLRRPLSGGPYGAPGASERIAKIVLRYLGAGQAWKPKDFRDPVG